MDLHRLINATRDLPTPVKVTLVVVGTIAAALATTYALAPAVEVVTAGGGDYDRPSGGSDEPYLPSTWASYDC